MQAARLTRPIPDGIEPILGYRSWRFSGSKLISQHDGSVWEPGQPYEAKCQHAYWEWYAVEGGGHSLEEIRRTSYYQLQPTVQYAHSLTAQAITPHIHHYGPPELPNVRLPEGYGYAARIVSHDVPYENCGCGVYASAIEGMNPPGEVRGEVHLWGKVIQGSQAHRATYAYPAKLYCHAHQREALEAYGVPIVVYKPKPKVPDRRRQERLELMYRQVAEQAAWQTAYTQALGRHVSQHHRRMTPLPRTTTSNDTSPKNYSTSTPLGGWWQQVKP